MKKQEIKKLSKDEVLKNIDKLKKDLFNFRFQKINTEVKNPAKINETKKIFLILNILIFNLISNYYQYNTHNISNKVSPLKCSDWNNDMK